MRWSYTWQVKLVEGARGDSVVEEAWLAGKETGHG